MNQRILALDLGRKVGWAVADDGEVYDHDVWCNPHEHCGEVNLYFACFGYWLCETLATLKPDLILLAKKHAQKSTASSESLFGLRGIVLEQCGKRNIQSFPSVKEPEVKKHMTGKGNAPKDAIVAAVQAQGIEVDDDNEADAVALVLWYVETCARKGI